MLDGCLFFCRFAATLPLRHDCRHDATLALAGAAAAMLLPFCLALPPLFRAPRYADAAAAYAALSPLYAERRGAMLCRYTAPYAGVVT